MKDILDSFRNLPILVIGDLMLDEYLWGTIDRISPEAPCPVVDLARQDQMAGGAGNVARNAFHLGARVSVVSVLGDDEVGGILLDKLSKMADVSGILRDPSRPTSQKTRILARSHHILRIDRESRRNIRQETEDRLLHLLCALPKPGAIVVSDYGKGLLTRRMLDLIFRRAEEWSVPTVVDPKGSDYSRYAGCRVITPNLKEAEKATGSRLSSDEEVALAAERIREVTRCAGVVITRGGDGMTVFDGDTTHIPTEAKEVYDVTGAGDTVCSLVALALASGLPLLPAARLANRAAGIVVEKVGTSWVTPEELLDRRARADRAKIQSVDQLRLTVSRLKGLGKRIVFTNGCFDLLHIGHIQYLAEARAQGEILVVGLNSDRSVRELKGPERPLIPEGERARILAALRAVDYVVIFDQLTPEAIISELEPHLLVKGGDYRIDQVVGRDIVASYGGDVRIIPLSPGISTSNIVKTIMERYSTGS